MAPCQIDSFADLVTCLEQAVTGDPPKQSIELSAALFAQAGALAALFGGTSLTIEQRDDQTPLLTHDAKAAHIVGDALLFAGAPQPYSYEVDVTGTYDTAPVLALAAKPADPATWTFAGNFAAAFPDYVGYDPPLISKLPSFLPGVDYGKPRFEATSGSLLTFKTEVGLATGTLAAVGKYLGAGPVTMSGPLVLRPGSFPTLDLSGVLVDWSVPKLPEVHFRLAAVDAGDGRPAASIVELFGSTAPGSYTALDVAAPLMRGDFSWELVGTPANPEAYSLAAGLKELSAEMGFPDGLTLPTGLDGLGGLYLKSILLAFSPSTSVGTLDLIGVRFGTLKGAGPIWSAPILGVAVDDVEIVWNVVDPMTKSPTLIGELGGTLTIDPVKLAVEVALSGLTVAHAPDVSFAVGLVPGSDLTIDKLFERFTGFDPDLDLAITELSLEGETGTRTLRCVATLVPDWVLPVPASVDSVSFLFDYAPNRISGQVALQVTLLDLPFLLSASYQSATKGWDFSGGLLPEGQGKSLQDVVDSLDSGWFPATLPANLGAIQLRGLSASFSTTDSRTTFDGVLGWPFVFPALDLTVDIEGEVSLTKSKTTAPAGFVRGTLKLNDFTVSVIYDFGVKNGSTITFGVAWHGVTLTCIVSQNDKGETILRANLGGASFGDIVGYLIGLAAGDAGFRLSAPWDVLYQLKFDELWLEVNLETKAVSISYDVGIDLGIVNVDSIALTYSKYAGSGSVEVSIVGEFVGTPFGKDGAPPLAWDMLNDPPPAPPGKGEALLDLRYLALGQNVAPRRTKPFTGILDVIETLKADFAPVDSTTNPLTQLPALKFSGDGRWLIAADFTVMGALSLKGVFSDPSLYGLRIGLAGPKVKSLAGLEFEILYQKVTDTIGLYHIELTLPTAMRELQFGAVSVTLPVITVDVYTNGNFRIDMGFPQGGDYSKSFCVQAGTFIGRGGFYFAVLDGATSSRVPVVTNGSFSPVIEFGVGLSVGMGRTLEAGVISGGLTITLEAIVEGVLAWFNPTDRSLPTDLFYEIRGSAAIVGKAWGAVDFVVVKASFSITASATVTLTIQSYAPIEVQLSLAVEVSASLKIFVFTLTFSFSAHLDLSFTIGERSQAPWQVAATDPKALPRQLRQMQTRHLPHAPRPLEAQKRHRALIGLAPEFDWSAARVIGDAPVDVDLMLTASLTPADKELQVVMALFVPTSTPDDALHAVEVARVEHPSAADVPFNRLAAGVLRWALGALKNPLAADGTVTIADLDAIARYLAKRENRDATFTYHTVTELIDQNFVLRISDPLAGGAQPKQVAVFPMVPALVMTAQGRDPVDFARFALADGAYRTALETYYDQLQPVAPDRTEQHAAAATGDDDEQSVATTLFCDYFGLVAQQAVEQAVRLMNAYPYEATGLESLHEVAGLFGGWKVEHRVRRGDTPATIAAEHGTTVAELRRTNEALRSTAARDRLAAGSTVAVEAGPTVARIAKANAGYPLATGARLTVTGVRHQVRSGETLGEIAGAFELDPADLLTLGDGWDNAKATDLLSPGAKLKLPPVAYTVTQDDVIDPAEAVLRIAATFYTRARQRAATPAITAQIAWYVATIGQLNPAFGEELAIPVATLSAAGQIENTGKPTQYRRRRSDTLSGIAEAFALLQLAPDDPGFKSYVTKLGAPPTVQPGQVLTLPAVGVPIQAGDSFKQIAAAFYLGPSEHPVHAGVRQIAQANPTTTMLQPRAVLAMPDVSYPVAARDTLGAIAERLDVSVEELADSAAEDVGILAPYAQTDIRITVPHVAARGVADLVADLTRFGSLNTLSTTVSRFLLNGMRAPKPPPPAQPLVDPTPVGLYEVAGQQLPGPVGLSGDYPIRFAKGASAPWLCLEAPPDEPLDCGDEMTVTLTPQFIEEHGPSPVLDPLTVAGPTAMRLYDLEPPRYPFQQHVPWQPASTVAVGPTASGATGFAAGGPSVWLFPTALQQVASGPVGVTASTRPYELLAQGPANPGATAPPPTPLERFSWATAIPLDITRAVDDRGGFVPGAYEVTGADQSARDLLLKAWTYLDAAPSPDDRLYLLRRASAASNNSSGLVSDDIDGSGTFLLRTNLSTETQSNASLLADSRLGDSGQFYAGIDSIAAFLREVWEASITGSGGFHLSYAAKGGGTLPPELFEPDGSASLWAVLLLDHQSRPAAPQRGLYGFNNCAVVAENLDATAATIYAELAEPEPRDRHAVASVPQGIVGFGLARMHPMGVTAAGPTGLTRQLHSLVGYQVQEGPDFSASHEGLPISPADAPPPWLHLPPGATAHAYWSYVHGIPIAQFGQVNDTPSSAALPPAAASPYRGITGPGPGTGRALSQATIGLAYHDVFGNTTASTKPLEPIDVPVGYIDDVIGVGSWPGSGLSYLFSPTGASGVSLETELTLHAERYVPGDTTSVEHALDAATGDAARYAQVFYQLGQRDTEVSIDSNIGAAQPLAGDLKAICSAFVTKAELFTDAASHLIQQWATTVKVEDLVGVATGFGVSPAALLTANPDVDATTLFPDLYVKPHIVPAPPMNTLVALAKQVVGRAGKSAGSPIACTGTGPDTSCDGKPSGGAAPTDVAEDNAGKPLTPGIVLRTTKQTSPPLVFGKKLVDSLAAVAVALGTPVYGEVVDPDNPSGPALPVGLVADNWTAAGLIADGVTVTIGDVTLVTKADTFALIWGAFNPDPSMPAVTKGDLAVALSGLPGLLVAGQTVDYASLIVPQPTRPPDDPAPAKPTFSLNDIPAAAGALDWLATANRCVGNFFSAGAPLLLGWSCCKAEAPATPATLARAAVLSIEQLADYNHYTPIGAGSRLVVPGLVALRDPASCWATYTPRRSDTLATAAAALGADPATIAEVNRQLLGLLQPGAQATVDGTVLPVSADDTLESLYARFSAAIGGLTWEHFVEQLGLPANAGLLRDGGAVAGPLPSPPAGIGGETPPIETFAAQLNVHPVALLTANRSLQTLLRPQATLNGPKGSSAEVGPYDTIDSVLRRLRAQAGEVDIAELVAENRGRQNLLAADARVLLPPAPTPCAMPFVPQIPPAGATGDAQIVFPVEVVATVSRAPGLVHPDFAGSDAVVRDATVLGPRIGDPSDTKLTLDAFAARFEQAFESERLKCAVAAGATSAAPGTTAPIWAVNFGPKGISSVAVDASRPTFYALPPLSTQPQAGELTFPSYASGSGLGPDITQRFADVDLDGWMRQFLDAVDLFLTPSFAVPAFRGPTGPAGGRGAAVAAPAAAAEGPIGIASAVPVDGLTDDPAAPGPRPTGVTANGPADYERVVDAKEKIAEALSKRVWPIVHAPGATASYGWSAAQDALRQQMLVRLSDAYDVSAVVQLPVDVTSPMFTPAGTTGDHPPRLSGQVVPVLHVVEPGGAGLDPADSIAAVAAGYDVSSPFLAETIADMQGLLRVDAVIDGHKVGPHDVLARLALPATPDDWATWCAFVEPVQAKSVFVERASFPLSRAQRDVFAGDSLTSLAEFFGRDPRSVARANQDRQGVLPAGPISFPSYPKQYDVTATDTLATVAAGLAKSNNTPLSLDGLADLLAANLVPLAVGATLVIVEPLPDVSLSTAKVSLGRIAALGGTPPPLSFLVSAKHAAQRSALLLNLDYAINELEHAIRDVPEAGAYQASSWLTFVRPFDPARGGADAVVDTAIPQVQIPMPLRAYPPAPMLTGQSGVASHPNAGTFPEVREWDYRYDFDVHSAAQDADHLRAVFGEAGGATLFEASAGIKSIFRALAAFITAYPVLKDDLARLPGLAIGAQDAIAAHAVQALSYLAQDVATELSNALASADLESASAADTYAYRMTTSNDGISLKTLTLTPEPPLPIGATAWPRMYARDPAAAGTRVAPDPEDAGYEELEQVDASRGLYEFPSGFGVDADVTYRARFSHRDVIRNATGRGAVSVSRNDRLIAHGPLGPTGSPAPVPTYERFIYQTPYVEFVDPLVPLIASSTPIDVTTLGAPLPAKKPLSTHLMNVLAKATSVVPLGPGAGEELELLCAYGFPLAESEHDSITVTTPIRLVPTRTVSPDDVAQFALDLSSSVGSWRSQAGIDETQGLLVFELTVLTAATSRLPARRPRASALPTAVAAAVGPPRKPILRLTELQLPLASIDWSKP